MKKSFFVVLLLCFGCFQNNTKVPSELLSESEMAEAMIQLHILEAKIYKLYIKEDSARKVYDHYEAMLFDSLDITPEQFEKSLNFYYGEVKLFKGVYQEVVDSLLSRQKRAKD